MEEIQACKAHQPMELSEGDIKVLVQTGIIPAGTPLSVVQLFSKFVKETSLSPFRKQVHLIKRKQKVGEKWEDRFTIQTGIDGYRAIANRTGVYAGNDDYVFNGKMTLYEVLEKKIVRPITATATVWKIVAGVRVPFTATAEWTAYYPGDDNKEGFYWRKNSFNQLGKCAEALAHRKAFPEETSGIYTDEEMQQDDIDLKVLDVKKQIEEHLDGEQKPAEETVPEIPESIEVKQDIPPVFDKPKQETYATYVMPMGLNKGKKLEDIPDEQLRKAMEWCIAHNKYDELVQKIEVFLRTCGLPF